MKKDYVGTAWVQLRGERLLPLSRKRRQTKPLGFLMCYFGTRSSKVQILSPRRFSNLQNAKVHLSSGAGLRFRWLKSICLLPS